MYKILFMLFGLIALSGCASTPATATKGDPLESYNRAMFAFNESVDNAVIKPVAEVYKDNLPQLVQTGVSNFFSNLNDIFVVINDVLQLKLGQATMDFSRLVWNSTIGLGGLIDVASHMDLPKHNEDLGQTLAHWGVGKGAYFVIPILGPSTLRDAAGLAVEVEHHPLNEIDDENTYWAAVGVMTIDKRANLLGASKIVDEAALDRYAFVRDAYLQHRLSLIYDGNPPRQEFEKAPAAPSKEDLELELELEQELQSAPAK